MVFMYLRITNPGPSIIIAPLHPLYNKPPPPPSSKVLEIYKLLGKFTREITVIDNVNWTEVLLLFFVCDLGCCCIFARSQCCWGSKRCYFEVTRPTNNCKYEIKVLYWVNIGICLAYILFLIFVCFMKFSLYENGGAEKFVVYNLVWALSSLFSSLVSCASFTPYM